MSVLNRRLAADLDKAFPSFVCEMQAAVFNGARRWLPTRQDAEDVSQETFVRAYQALQSYSPDRIAALSLRSWLFTITLNLCRNHARTRGRRPAQVVFGETDRAGGDDPQSAALEAVSVDEWRERLAALTPRQRDGTVLRHVVGLSYAEIAEVVGRPEGTVKSDVHRGLSRLRSMMERTQDE